MDFGIIGVSLFYDHYYYLQKNEIGECPLAETLHRSDNIICHIVFL